MEPSSNIGLAALIVVLGLYFLPTIIASSRRHHNTGAIFATNLLVGWTFVGWVISFVWSVTAVNPALSKNRQHDQRAPTASLQPPPLPGQRRKLTGDEILIGGVVISALLGLVSWAALPPRASTSVQADAPPGVMTAKPAGAWAREATWTTVSEVEPDAKPVTQQVPKPVKPLVTGALPPPKPKGGWRVDTEKSPIDDSTNVHLQVTSIDTVRGRYGDATRLTLGINCRENRTTIYVHFGGHFMASSAYDNSGAVTHRVDQRPAEEYGWTASTNHEALMAGDADAIIIAKQLFGGRRLLVRATPYGESPLTATFNVEGLDEAIKPLRAACAW